MNVKSHKNIKIKKIYVFEKLINLMFKMKNFTTKNSISKNLKFLKNDHFLSNLNKF